MIFKKLISILVILTMLAETCFAQVPGLSLDMAFKTETPKLIQIDIPAELASVDEFWEAPARPNPKMILHIQNAHTNYEAQQKIRDLMTYLNKNYGFKTIFVEGASENLDPKYLKLFPDVETNRKLWDELAKRGQITGADWFLLENAATATTSEVNRSHLGGGRGDLAPTGIGIEKAELYRKNYEALKAVYSREAETTKFLGGLESELDKLATKILPAETRKILSEWKKFEKGHREFMPFVENLAKLAKQNINLDLHGLYSQIEWPQLTRLLVLQEMEAKLKGTAYNVQRTPLPGKGEGQGEGRTIYDVRSTVQQGAELERRQMLEWMKKNGVSKELITGLERFNEKDINMNRIRASSGKMESLPRFFIEKLVEEAGPKGLKFSEYPNFALYTGYLILKYEIDPSSLFSEIKKLFEKLLDVNSKTYNVQRTAEAAETPRGLPKVSPGVAEHGDLEQKLIALFRDAELIRKLFNLELSREEWQKTLTRKNELTPDQLFKRVKGLVNGTTYSVQRSPLPVRGEGQGEGRTMYDVRSTKSVYQKQILVAFDNALSFYDLAIRRDEVFYQKMAKELETTDRAILMTGGFHTDGLKQIFREKEISYGTLTPRLTQVEKSNLYREVMLGKTSHEVFPAQNLELKAQSHNSKPSNLTGERGLSLAARQTGTDPNGSKSDDTVEIWSLLNSTEVTNQMGVQINENEFNEAFRTATAGKSFNGQAVANHLNAGLFRGQTFEISYNNETRRFEIAVSNRSGAHTELQSFDTAPSNLENVYAAKKYAELIGRREPLSADEFKDYLKKIAEEIIAETPQGEREAVEAVYRQLSHAIDNPADDIEKYQGKEIYDDVEMITNPTFKSLESVAMYLVKVIKNTKKLDDAFPIYLARDGAFFYFIRDALFRKANSVSKGTVSYLARANISAEAVGFVKALRIMSDGRKVNYAKFLSLFQDYYNSGEKIQPRSQAGLMRDDVMEGYQEKLKETVISLKNQLLEMNLSGKVLLVDSGSLGTVPLLLMGVVSLFPEEFQDVNLDFVLMNAHQMLGPGKQFEEAEKNRIEAGSMLEELEYRFHHPFEFNSEANAAVKASPSDQLKFEFERLLIINAIIKQTLPAVLGDDNSEKRSEARARTVGPKEIRKVLTDGTIRLPRDAVVVAIGTGAGEKIQLGSKRIDWEKEFSEVPSVKAVYVYEPAAKKIEDLDSAVSKSPKVSFNKQMFDRGAPRADVLIAMSVFSDPGLEKAADAKDNLAVIIAEKIKKGGYLVLGYYTDKGNPAQFKEEQRRHNRYLKMLKRLGVSLTPVIRGTDARHHWTMYEVTNNRNQRSESRVEQVMRVAKIVAVGFLGLASVLGLFAAFMVVLPTLLASLLFPIVILGIVAFTLDKASQYHDSLQGSEPAKSQSVLAWVWQEMTADRDRALAWLKSLVNVSDAFDSPRNARLFRRVTAGSMLLIFPFYFSPFLLGNVIMAIAISMTMVITSAIFHWIEYSRNNPVARAAVPMYWLKVMADWATNCFLAFSSFILFLAPFQRPREDNMNINISQLKYSLLLILGMGAFFAKSVHDVVARNLNLQHWPEIIKASRNSVLARSEMREPWLTFQETLDYSPDLKAFIETFLKRRYGMWNLDPAVADGMIRALKEGGLNEGEIINKLREVKLNANNTKRLKPGRVTWNEGYGEYKKTKYVTTFEQIKGELEQIAELKKLEKEGSPNNIVRLLDVGAGNMELAGVVAEAYPDWIVMGTDPYPTAKSGKWKFYKQTSATELPADIDDGSLDVVTLNAALHHVDQYESKKDRDLLLASIFRKLKPGGKIILIEDTYSEGLVFPPDSDQELGKQFKEGVSSYGDEFAKRFFSFIDWYTNIAVHGWEGMNMAYEFHSIEEWQTILKSAEFKQTSGRWDGFPEKSFHKPALGIVVAFKPIEIQDPTPGRMEARRSEIRDWNGFVDQETWTAMKSWPIVLGNKIPVTGFNDFYEVQLFDPSSQPAFFLGPDKKPLKFVLKIYQDGDGTHKLREATEVGVYEKIMQAAIDQPIEGQPGSWIHVPAGLMGGVFRGSDIYEVDTEGGYQAPTKKGLLMVWVPGIDMEDLLMSETWIESYREMETPNQIPNPNFNFAANPLGAYKALASALIETLYRFHKVTGRVHGDIKLDAFKVQYLDESERILDVNLETGEMALKLIDYDASADNRVSLANIKPQEVLGTWGFVSHRQVALASVGGQDFRISAANYFDDYVSLALMLAYLWMDPADVKKFLQPNQQLGETELSSRYHKRILGKDTRLEFIREHGNLDGNPLKDWILDVLNLNPKFVHAGYNLDEDVRSYFIKVLSRSEMRIEDQDLNDWLSQRGFKLTEFAKKYIAEEVKDSKKTYAEQWLEIAGILNDALRKDDGSWDQPAVNTAAEQQGEEEKRPIIAAILREALTAAGVIAERFVFPSDENAFEKIDSARPVILEMGPGFGDDLKSLSGNFEGGQWIAAEPAITPMIELVRKMIAGDFSKDVTLFFGSDMDYLNTPNSPQVDLIYVLGPDPNAGQDFASYASKLKTGGHLVIQPASRGKLDWEKFGGLGGTLSASGDLKKLNKKELPKKSIPAVLGFNPSDLREQAVFVFEKARSEMRVVYGDYKSLVLALAKLDFSKKWESSWSRADFISKLKEKAGAYKDRPQDSFVDSSLEDNFWKNIFWVKETNEKRTKEEVEHLLEFVSKLGHDHLVLAGRDIEAMVNVDLVPRERWDESDLVWEDQLDLLFNSRLIPEASYSEKAPNDIALINTAEKYGKGKEVLRFEIVARLKNGERRFISAVVPGQASHVSAGEIFKFGGQLLDQLNGGQSDALLKDVVAIDLVRLVHNHPTDDYENMHSLTKPNMAWLNRTDIGNLGLVFDMFKIAGRKAPIPIKAVQISMVHKGVEAKGGPSSILRQDSPISLGRPNASQITIEEIQNAREAAKLLDELDSQPRKDLFLQDLGSTVREIKPIRIRSEMRGDVEARKEIDTAISESPVVLKDGQKVISFKEFMRISLKHYYSKHAIIGSDLNEVHFVTHPEKSVLFGRGMAVQLHQMWETMGSPEKFSIVEMGAGNGKLAEDILDTAKQMGGLFKDGFYNAIQYQIIEMGDKLVENQKERLTPHQGKVKWTHGSAVDFKMDPIDGVFLSNELPDTFPAYRFREREGVQEVVYIQSPEDGTDQYQERWVPLQDIPADEAQFVRDQLRLMVNNRRPGELEDAYRNHEIAINSQIAEWYRNVSDHLTRGYIITVDYGIENYTFAPAKGLAVRTYGPGKSHDIEEALSLPGTVDITADVNFLSLANAGESDGLEKEGLLPEKQFFENIGIPPERLSKSNDFFVLIHSWGIEAGNGLVGVFRDPQEKYRDVIDLPIEATGDIVSGEAVTGSDDRSEAQFDSEEKKGSIFSSWSDDDNNPKEIVLDNVTTSTVSKIMLKVSRGPSKVTYAIDVFQLLDDGEEKKMGRFEVLRDDVGAFYQIGFFYPLSALTPQERASDYLGKGIAQTIFSWMAKEMIKEENKSILARFVTNPAMFGLSNKYFDAWLGVSEEKSSFLQGKGMSPQKLSELSQFSSLKLGADPTVVRYQDLINAGLFYDQRIVGEVGIVRGDELIPYKLTFDSLQGDGLGKYKIDPTEESPLHGSNEAIRYLLIDSRSGLVYEDGPEKKLLGRVYEIEKDFSIVMTPNRAEMRNMSWARELSPLKNGLNDGTPSRRSKGKYTFTAKESEAIKVRAIALRELIVEANSDKKKNAELLTLLSYPSFVLFWLGLKPAYISTKKTMGPEPGIPKTWPPFAKTAFRDQKIEIAPNIFYRAVPVAERLMAMQKHLKENLTSEESWFIKTLNDIESIEADEEFISEELPGKDLLTKLLDAEKSASDTELDRDRFYDMVYGIILGFPLKEVRKFVQYRRGVKNLDMVRVKPSSEEMGQPNLNLDDIFFAAEMVQKDSAKANISDEANTLMARYHDALNYFFNLPDPSSSPTTQLRSELRGWAEMTEADIKKAVFGVIGKEAKIKWEGVNFISINELGQLVLHLIPPIPAEERERITDGTDTGGLNVASKFVPITLTRTKEGVSVNVMYPKGFGDPAASIGGHEVKLKWEKELAQIFFGKLSGLAQQLNELGLPAEFHQDTYNGPLTVKSKEEAEGWEFVLAELTSVEFTGEGSKTQELPYMWFVLKAGVQNEDLLNSLAQVILAIKNNDKELVSFNLRMPANVRNSKEGFRATPEQQLLETLFETIAEKNLKEYPFGFTFPTEKLNLPEGLDRTRHYSLVVVEIRKMNKAYQSEMRGDAEKQKVPELPRSELRLGMIAEMLPQLESSGETTAATLVTILAWGIAAHPLIVVGGTIFVLGVLAMIVAAAKALKPKSSLTSEMLTTLGWSGQDEGMTIELMPVARLEEIGAVNMEEILKANPASRYGVFITDQGTPLKEWETLVKKYPGRFFIESRNIKIAIANILQAQGNVEHSGVIQITGRIEDIQIWENKIQKAVGKERNLRIVAFEKAADLPKLQPVRIARTVFASQHPEDMNVGMGDALFARKNPESFSWNIVTKVLGQLAELANTLLAEQVVSSAA